MLPVLFLQRFPSIQNKNFLLIGQPGCSMVYQWPVVFQVGDPPIDLGGFLRSYSYTEPSASLSFVSSRWLEHFGLMLCPGSLNPHWSDTFTGGCSSLTSWFRLTCSQLQGNVVPFDSGWGSGCIHGQLEQVELHLPVPSSSGLASFAGVSAPAVVIRESASYHTSVGETTLVQAAATVVFLPPPPQPQMLPGQGHFLVREVLTYSCLDFTLAAFTLLSCRVGRDAVLGYWGLSRNQYVFSWKAF